MIYDGLLLGATKSQSAQWVPLLPQRCSPESDKRERERWINVLAVHHQGGASFFLVLAMDIHFFLCAQGSLLVARLSMPSSLHSVADHGSSSRWPSFDPSSPSAQSIVGLVARPRLRTRQWPTTGPRKKENPKTHAGGIDWVPTKLHPEEMRREDGAILIVDIETRGGHHECQGSGPCSRGASVPGEISLVASIRISRCIQHPALDVCLSLLFPFLSLLEAGARQKR